jgi:tetratricopeptide (TPR) repeat protein
VAYDLDRRDEALEHLRQAADFYRVDHPRFPALAYDAGFFLMREGYFSCALLLFERVLPWVENQRVSILVRSALARSAAAVRDHIRFQRQAAIVQDMATADDEDSANALYQLAEGARSFMDWDRAHDLAQAALVVAHKRHDATIITYVEHLVAALAGRLPGDVDRVPPEGDAVDAVTQQILKKLNKRPAPALKVGLVPPERYPTE